MKTLRESLFDYIEEAFIEMNFNKTHLADLLGVNLRTVRYWFNKNRLGPIDRGKNISPRFGTLLWSIESRYIYEALERNSFALRRTAEELGISHVTLRKKIKMNRAVGWPFARSKKKDNPQVASSFLS